MSEISTKAGVFETGKKDEFGVAYQGNRLISCSNKSLTEYSVREGTEVICDRAFMNAKDLRSIKLPASIKALGESAFAGCKSLQDINIPEGVTEIRQSTFRDCKSLSCLELPSSCVKIEKWAFSDGLETLVCNAPSMQLDKSAFFGCKTLSTVMVPEGSAVAYAQALVDCRLTPDIEEIPTSDEENKDDNDDYEEDWNFGGLIGSSEEEDDEKEPVDETKVTLYFYGEGVRIDVMDKEDDLMDSFMALREDCIYDIELDRGDYHKNLSIEDLGKTLNELDEDDPDYKESYDWGDWPNMYNPEEIFDNVGRLVWIMSKTGAFVNIELEEGEKFDPNKLRLLSSEIVTPDGEFEVYCGALYNGKEYPLEIDIDSENVKGQQDLWIAEEEDSNLISNKKESVMEEKEAYYNGEGLPVLPTVEVNENGIPIVRLNFDLYHLNSGCITGDDVYDYLEESQGVLFFGLSDRATVNNPFQGIAFDCVPTSDDGELSGALDNFLSSDKTTAEQTLENGLLMWVYNFDLTDEMVDEYSDEDEDWHYDMAEKALKAINLIFGIPKNYNYDGPEAIFDLKVATLDDEKIEGGYHHRFHVYKENGEWTSKELPLD